MRTDTQKYGNNMGTFVLRYRLCRLCAHSAIAEKLLSPFIQVLYFNDKMQYVLGNVSYGRNAII